MNSEPSDEELSAFVESMLSNFDKHLREPEVIADAIREHRETWVLLYRASQGFDAAAPSPRSDAN